MTHADLVFPHCLLDYVGQIQQSQGIGDGSSAFAYPFRNFFMGEAKLDREALVGGCSFQRVEVSPLYVFNQRYQ